MDEPSDDRQAPNIQAVTDMLSLQQGLDRYSSSRRQRWGPDSQAEDVEVTKFQGMKHQLRTKLLVTGRMDVQTRMFEEWLMQTNHEEAIARIASR